MRTRIVGGILSAFWILAQPAPAVVQVQWGESPNGTGTPGTNIVTVNQTMPGVGTTYTGQTNSPAVGASYYVDHTNRSPVFSVAVSSTAQGGARVVENATSGDRLALYGSTVPAGGTYRSMVMWASNQFLHPAAAGALTQATVVLLQRTNPDTTAQALHLVIRQGDSYYLSDGSTFSSTVTTQTFALASRTWSSFTPFTSGVEVVGSPVSTPTWDAVQAIGFYVTTQNGGAAAGASGANVSYFMVEGSEAGGPTYTLAVVVDDVQRGAVSPTGGVYAAGEPVVVTATASNYFQFSHWSGDVGGNTNPLPITMNSDVSLTAHFTPQVAAHGTPLYWLAEHGLSADDSGEASDTDSDGVSAGAEYVAGTVPTSAVSVLSVKATRAGSEAILSWPTVTGRVYAAEWATAPNASYDALPGQTNLPSSVTSVTDTLHAASASAVYRITVQLE